MRSVPAEHFVGHEVGSRIVGEETLVVADGFVHGFTIHTSRTEGAEAHERLALADRRIEPLPVAQGLGVASFIVELLHLLDGLPEGGPGPCLGPGEYCSTRQVVR